MALFKSQIATAISGSVGGTTYAHNKSGMYMRARSIPVQPDSSAQLQVRSALTELVTRWKNTLTAAQRAAWELYAQNVSVTNPLGDAVNNSGQNWYIGCNVPRRQAIAKIGSGIALVDAGPTIFDRGDFTTPSPSYDSTSGFSASYSNSDDWANEDGGALLIYQGAPQDASISFFKGPYRLIATVDGDGTTPPTSPVTVTASGLASEGYGIAAGQAIWTAIAVTRADGRLSTRRNIGPIIVT